MIFHVVVYSKWMITLELTVSKNLTNKLRIDEQRFAYAKLVFCK